MGVDIKKYAYRVRWSEADDAFEGTVAELPGLTFLGKDQVSTLEGVVALASEAVTALEDRGEEVPIPFAEQSYSGSIRLRVTPEQHRELTIMAAEQGVSLNRFLCSMLAPTPRTRLVGTDIDLDAV